MHVRIMKHSFRFTALDSFLWSIITTELKVQYLFKCSLKYKIAFNAYQYWNTATSKFVGYCVTSMIGADERSLMEWWLLRVFDGEGGELDSAWVVANVVIKFLFKCTASYSANSKALFCLESNSCRHLYLEKKEGNAYVSYLIWYIFSSTSSERNMFPTIEDSELIQELFCTASTFVVCCLMNSNNVADITCPKLEKYS